MRFPIGSNEKSPRACVETFQVGALMGRCSCGTGAVSFTFLIGNNDKFEFKKHRQRMLLRIDVANSIGKTSNVTMSWIVGGISIGKSETWPRSLAALIGKCSSHEIDCFASEIAVSIRKTPQSTPSSVISIERCSCENGAA